MIWPNQRLLDLLGIDRRGVASAVNHLQTKQNKFDTYLLFKQRGKCFTLYN